MSVKCPLKAAAKARGDTQYVSATPCKNGHGLIRSSYDGNCVECRLLRKRASDARNRTSINEAAKLRKRIARAKNPRSERRKSVRTKMLKAYGLTEHDYQSLYDKQEGHCAICQAFLVSRLDDTRDVYSGNHAPDNYTARVDHCHKTGIVRGLLCSRCNTGLGQFQDNEQFLQQAIGYLRASATQ